MKLSGRPVCCAIVSPHVHFGSDSVLINTSDLRHESTNGPLSISTDTIVQYFGARVGHRRKAKPSIGLVSEDLSCLEQRLTNFIPSSSSKHG